MRLYYWASNDELTRIGVHGLVPTYPNTLVSVMLEKYLLKHPKTVHIYGKIDVKLSVEATYAGLTANAENLYVKQSAFKRGVMLAFNLNNKRKYRMVVANYHYKARIYELLMLKNGDREVETGKFKDYEEGVWYYAQKYFNSVKTIKQFKEELKSIDYGSGTEGSIYFSKYKVLSSHEALLYFSIPVENVFVFLGNKKIMPLLEWLYKHRGLYLNKINTASTYKKMQVAKEEYSTFKRKYTAFKKREASEGESYLKEIYYVKPGKK